MRGLIMASMAALVLSGLPPAPPAPLAAQGARGGGVDADSICAPFSQDFRADVGDRAGAGRSVRQRVGGVAAAPPPPPPPPPPPAVAQQQSGEEQIAVTGSRVPQPQLNATSPVTVV